MLEKGRRSSAGMLLLLLLIIISSAPLVTATAAPLKRPTYLLVDGIGSPMAVDSNSIYFTWMMNDSKRGSMQAAYQLEVASSRKNIEKNIGDMWNSGKVISSRSAGVVYDGKAVSAATRYWWKVRVWDNHGEESPWSDAAIFGVGLSKSDWKADYIWDGTTNQNNYTYFRKVFRVTRKPKLAKVYVSGHNDYMLYFNGHFLGRGPARSDPYNYGQYNSYDITKLVRAGRNVFAAIGHWQGNWHDSGCNAKPAFLLEAEFDYPDGTSSMVGTNASWKVLAHTPFIENDPTYFGVGGGADNRAAIKFDSQKEPTGWKKVCFNDSRWASASVVDRSGFHLYAQRASMEREQAELNPVSINYENGAWLVNFKRCIDGWPKLTMRSNHPGDTVRISYYEMKGLQYPAGWDEYICHGGTETWDADFGRHTSFEELRITGYAGKLNSSDVRGVLAYSNADVAGRFHCSNTMVDSIYEMCVRSAQQNVQQGIISVDANREQSQWLADSWNVGNVLLYNDRNATMIDKVLRDFAGEQMPDGDFYACSPVPMFKIAEWSMYWPMLLWQQYLFSGDVTLLHTMAPRLLHFMNWIKQYRDSTTGLINPPGWRISDWAAVNKMPSGGYNVATECQYYDNLSIAADVFAVLGKPDLSGKYRRQAGKLKASINADLFNGDFYLVRPDSTRMYPLASAWPLRFDIELAAARPRILARVENAGKPEIGGYGGDALYAGMLNAGDGDYVVRDLARYRPMLEGNDANWESFELNPSRGYEVNHAWTAYPGYLLQKYFAGIQPTSGGFATFDVRPVVSGLRYAQGTVPTVKGLVTTSWKRKSDGRFELSVIVPANTSATVYIPKLTNGNITITESGRQLWPVKYGIRDLGVIKVAEDSSAIKCLVGSGHYRFLEMSPDPR